MDNVFEAATTVIGIVVPILMWLVNRALGRVDSMEKDIDALRIGQVRDYHTKAEIEKVVASSLAPVLVSLRNIERELTGRSSIPGRTTGRFQAIPDDGN